jgi:hypothetical protein
MDGALALVVIVGVVTLGITISSVVSSFRPNPPRLPLSKFDAIDDELSRLHGELGEYSSAPGWISHEIGRLNDFLINEKETEK